MVDSALIWLGLVAAGGLLCLVGGLWQYVKTDEVNYWGIAGACVATGGVVELLIANEYVTETTLSTTTNWLFLALGFVFILVALRRHGLGRNRSSDSL
ncbi:hypothetical protein [Halomarina oriensis]|uniref:Uncharacterized protein n=1 Tax=Halomarina oriensis TaxID=671145 RepID=A0A6B0GWG5_9EURY|nr:hypothetical protein [Halomarina oriensis]MWG36078.1 hypothetical protein [Halomarina oriensis]